MLWGSVDILIQTATFAHTDVFLALVCVWNRVIWPTWQLVDTKPFYNTSVHTHSHIHAQMGKGKRKRRAAQAHIQTSKGCKQNFFFFYQRQEYKIALPQCALWKALWSDYCIRKKQTLTQTQHVGVGGIKKFSKDYITKPFGSPEFIKHKQNRQKGQSSRIVEIHLRRNKNSKTRSVRQKICPVCPASVSAKQAKKIIDWEMGFRCIHDLGKQALCSICGCCCWQHERGHRVPNEVLIIYGQQHLVVKPLNYTSYIFFYRVQGLSLNSST